MERLGGDRLKIKVIEPEERHGLCTLDTRSGPIQGNHPRTHVASNCKIRRSHPVEVSNPDVEQDYPGGNEGFPLVDMDRSIFLWFSISGCSRIDSLGLKWEITGSQSALSATQPNPKWRRGQDGFLDPEKNKFIKLPAPRFRSSF